MRPEESQTPAPDRLSFAEFTVELRSRELFRDGRRVPLQDRPFEVLAALLERPGEVVLREELRERLWPGQIVEFDNNLNTAVTKLRRALEDTTEEPRIVETLPKRGYRLLVPVEASRADGPKPASRKVPRLTLAALLALLALAVYLAVRPRSPVSETASTVPSANHLPAPAAPTRTALLMVLPFEPGGLESGEGQLADALTGELIARLAERLPPELGVIARTSTMAFRGQTVGLDEIAARLGVGYVLEGSVARSADGLRVTAGFFNAADQAHLWAETYEAPLDELPRVQSSIAERIATTLAGRLRSGAAQAATASVSKAPWEDYLRAKYLMTSRLELDVTDLETATGLLRRAVERAPEFALAWAALADAISWQSGPAAERAMAARAAAQRALRLDPSLAGPHHRLANLALYYDWDWEGAKREFDWALSLAPNLALSHHSVAAWYSTQGRHDEALEAIERALQLDPLSVVLHADTGWYLYVARRYEEAVARCQQAISLVPDHRGANSYLLRSLLALGRRDEAAPVARRLLAIEGADDERLRRAGRSADAALQELARHRLATNEGGYRAGEASPARVALAHLELGRTADALRLLQEGADRRWGWIYPFLAVYPQLDPLAEAPAFRRLVERVGVGRTAAAR